MVSIIIPVYNGEKIIDKCLDSVLASSEGYDREILVIDDASIDKTREAVGRYMRDNMTLLTNSKNLGFAKAVKKGLIAAKGDIVILLNMDTVVDRGWLKGLIEPLERNTTIGITGSKILFIDTDNIKHAGGYLNKTGLSYHIGAGSRDDGQYEEEREVQYVCGASLACRRDILKKLGGIDTGYSPMYYEEIDMAYKFRKAGYKIVYVPYSILRHYGGYAADSKKINVFYFSSRNRLRYILKSYPARRVLFGFVYHEIRYFLKLDIRKKLCLLKAYIYTIFKIPEILLVRLKEEILVNALRLKRCMSPFM